MCIRDRTETDKDRTIGLSSTDASVSNTSIEFAFRLRTTGALNIYESGTNRGTFGTYLTGDALKIAVENNVVKYYRNGTMIYISSVSPTLPLYVDVSLRNVGATATAVQVANGNTGTFSAVALNLGPAPTYQWTCLLYTSDAADERSSVDLGGRRIIKKKRIKKKQK